VIYSFSTRTTQNIETWNMAKVWLGMGIGIYIHEIQGTSCVCSLHMNNVAIAHLPYLWLPHPDHSFSDPVNSVQFSRFCPQFVYYLYQLQLLQVQLFPTSNKWVQHSADQDDILRILPYLESVEKQQIGLKNQYVFGPILNNWMTYHGYVLSCLFQVFSPFWVWIPLIIFCAKEGDIMTLPSNTEEEKPYGSLDSDSMSFGTFF